MKTLMYKKKVEILITGLCLGLVVGVMPVAAQQKEEPTSENRTIRVKMIKNVNGKSSVVDTSFKLAPGEPLPKFLKMEQINEIKKLPEIRELTRLKEITVLKDENIRLLPSKIEEFEKRWHSGDFTGDSTNFIFLRNTGLPDSIGSKIFSVGKKYQIRMTTKSDTLVKYGIYIKDHMEGNAATVFRLKENGLYEEESLKEIIKDLKGNVITTPGKPSRIIIVRKFVMTDLTEKDKAALKKSLYPSDATIKENLQLQKLEYYPNPSHGSFRLSFRSEKKDDVGIKIYDANGREVYTETVEGFTGNYDRKIDISDLGHGMYFLKVVQGKSGITKKLLVE